MTREEVKAQLAKNPLEWEETIYPDDIVTTALTFGGSVKIQYTIEGGSLGAMVFGWDRPIFGMCLHCGGGGLEAKAEAHRLELICRMLGIND